MKTTQKKVFLYDLPQRVPGGIEVHFSDLILRFHHLDGMYSYCTVAEGKSKGKPFHLAAYTPLVEHKTIRKTATSSIPTEEEEVYYEVVECN